MFSFLFTDDDGHIVITFLKPREGEMTIKLTYEGVTEIKVSVIVEGGGASPPAKTVIHSYILKSTENTR